MKKSVFARVEAGQGFVCDWAGFFNGGGRPAIVGPSIDWSREGGGGSGRAEM